MSGKKSVAERLREVGASFRSAVPAKLTELEAAARPLFDGASPNEALASLTDVRALAHKLAGSAGTFGYGAISECARALEEFADRVLAAGEGPSDAQTAEVEALVSRLKDAAPVEPTPKSRGATGGAAQERPIFVLVPGELGKKLSRRLTEHGAAVQLFSSAEEIDDSALQPPPRAIVVHTDFPGGTTICRRLADGGRNASGTDVPITFVSRSGDLASRLRAVRAGAKNYLVEPLDLVQVAQAIDAAACAETFVPFRILVVEDDGNLAQQCAKAFEGPGYVTRVVDGPATVFDCLASFDAELIVIDVSLKQCSGVDLARVIWQRLDRQDTSILFVTPGPEFNRELVKLGAPDEYFLPRPLDTNAMCALAARHLFKVRSGQEPANRAQLLGCLDRAAAMGTAAAIDKKAGAARKGQTQAEAAPPTGPRVLVVDDDVHIVNGIAIQLAAHGIEVLKAFSGEQAFEAAWREHPDLIISDYGMPKGSGEYLLTRLKSTAETKHIPVVILTGRRVGGSKDYALERDLCGRLGAASYLSKPIDFDAVVREIGELIELPGATAARPGRASRR